MVSAPVPTSASGQHLSSRWSRWRQLLTSSVSGASLGIFRIGFGLVMLLEAFTLFSPSASSGDRSHFEVYYSGGGARFHFPYPGFEWLPILPDSWMPLIGWGLGLGAVLVALGLWYRFAVVAVFLCWGYLYALESTRTYWMSYYYLELLVSFLLIWMPAARRYGIDAWRFRSKSEDVSVPAWTVWLLRGQLVVTYFYAGVAKLNLDWLSDFMPVRWFLAQPHVGQRLDQFLGANLAAQVKPWLVGEAGAAFISWTGAAFDVGVGFLLLGRRTRLLGLGLMWLFHGINHFLLFNDIEWFPLVGATTALIFLDADWPERCLKWIRKPSLRAPDWPWAIAGAIVIPGIGFLLGCKPTAGSTSRPRASTSPIWPIALCLVWMGWQIAMPLRHWLIPGDARITFEGLSFSWRLKAELYQSSPATILIGDPVVLTSIEGTTRIDWQRWPDDKVLLREVIPGHIPWADLAPIVAVTDPEFGERILFNPLSTKAIAETEIEARNLATRMWTELYGRPPAALHRAVSVGQIVDAYTKAARSRGLQIRDRSQAASMLIREHGRSGNGQMLPFLRRTQPFPTSLDDVSSAPFLWLDDPVVLPVLPKKLPRIDRTAWHSGTINRGRADRGRSDIGGDPVVLHCDSSENAGDARAGIWQSLQPSIAPPEIRWNLVRDAGVSKAMHIGVQPFLLRRYARRVAAEWESATGHRARITARTSVALNGRPPQAIVDPSVDLSAVDVAWFGHNPWILDLATPRIPAGTIPHRPMETVSGAAP